MNGKQLGPFLAAARTIKLTCSMSSLLLMKSLNESKHSSNEASGDIPNIGDHTCVGHLPMDGPDSNVISIALMPLPNDLISILMVWSLHVASSPSSSIL